MNANDLTQMPAMVGAIITAISGIALVAGVLIKLLVDGFKATGKVPDGSAGSVAIAIGLGIGVLAGIVLVGLDDASWYVLILTGLGGLAAGAMAIGAHMAVTNTEPPVEPAPATTAVTTPVATVAAPAATTAAKPATTASSVVTFTPAAAGPKASDALDV